MIKRILVLGVIIIGIGVMVCSAQQPQQPQKAAPNKAVWTPPKTAWGEPDLQGMWPLNHLISTPFERPVKFGNRQMMTDEKRLTVKAGAKRLGLNLKKR